MVPKIATMVIITSLPAILGQTSPFATSVQSIFTITRSAT